jgi:hypothetical protein
MYVEGSYNMRVGKLEAVKIMLFKTVGGQIICALLAGWVVVGFITAPSHEQARAAARAQAQAQELARRARWRPSS